LTARHLVVLVIGVFAVSWAAPLIRLADGAPVLVIAALRLSIAAPPMVAVALATGGAAEARRLSRRDVALLIASGVALAGHFAVWVAAVQRTSILTGVVLVTMQPLFVSLGAWIALREPPERRVLAGIALGLFGALLLTGADLGARGSLLGDVLALTGAMLVSIYLVIGRGVRARVSTLTYAGIVYSVTAVALLALVLSTRTPIGGAPREAYLYIVLLALVPQLIGHNAFNWALGSLPAAVVAIAILGEPVGASAIGAVVLHEVPGPIQWVGAAVVLFGVYVALREGAPAELPAAAESIEI
jgi:drug/metabolite transporter (DMT)-like permease